MESIPVNSGFETLIDMECPHCRVESLDHGNRKDTLFKLLLGASIPNRVCRSVGLSVKKVFRQWEASVALSISLSVW